MASKIRRRLGRVKFTLSIAAAAIFLIGLICFAIYDSVSSAKVSDDQVRKSTLTAELSNFLLAIREPDGSSLLENPKDFSASERPLRFVSLRRSFYSYLLNRANAGTLTAEKMYWDLPRPCIVEFSLKGDAKALDPLFNAQACFSVVPSEVGGHYAYFSIRYPTRPLIRHKPGEDLQSADRVVLSLGGERPTTITMVYELPSLAASRYPSQTLRFAGIHEMSAFMNGSPHRPMLQINAQAFEHIGDQADPRNFVTIVGRIDGNLLDPQSDTVDHWPSPAVGNVKIGMSIYSHTTDGNAKLLLGIAPGADGQTLVSLKKAFLSSVTSESRLDIVSNQKGIQKKVWSSADLKLPVVPRRTDWSQAISDWWAPKLMHLLLGKDSEPTSVNTDYRISGPGGEFSASLTATPGQLPVAATRAFGWLTAALLIVLALVTLGSFVVYRFAKLTRSAWHMTLSSNYVIDKKTYGRQRDEISTLGRTLNALFARNRSRNAHLVNRIRREALEKAKDLKLMQVQLDLRQDRLGVIGHEIRSPLETLLNRTIGNEELRTPLLRMRDAVETIFEAATGEDGINEQEIVCARTDVADFLSRLVENKGGEAHNLRYEGPRQGIWSNIDDIKFESVIDHLVDNAERYKPEGSPVTISLELRDQAIFVEVFNLGPSIPEERMKTLFKYRQSDQSTSRNQGIGLYASRAYLFGMKATITTENKEGGVAMIIELPIF